ncbi:hypothetical protein ACLMJK_008167 [Lecanora helva]
MDRLLLAEMFALAFIVYVLGLYVYRMFFNRLSHIPGPKLAAATLWYEFYYDVILKGRYTFKIKELHEKYGPIIRISPYEVHIDDPEYIDTVYPGSSPRTMKYDWAMKMFGLRTSIIVTGPPELHRIRRGSVANYFSKASLQKLEPGVQYQVDKLASRLKGLQGSGRIVNLLDVFACLTGDVVGQYAFAKPYGFLDDKDFAPFWHQMAMDVSQNGHMLKQFGWLMPMMQSMPKWMVKVLQPQMLALLEFQERFRRQVLEAKAEVAAGEKPKGQTTIFYDVLSNPDCRPEEKDIDHLQDQAQELIGAGTVTTAHILAYTTFRILWNPSVRAKLEAELGEIMSRTGGKPKWTQLEQLPYLTGVITEGLRISYGVSSRLQRLFPDTVLQYNGYAIPTMTAVSMTSVFVHDNPDIFPDPSTFIPERFIEQPQLKRYLLTFSKGSRQCLGMNLAYAELYLTLAAVFAPGQPKLKLFETDLSDVELKHDFLNTSPRLDSKGIRVTIE